MPIDDQVFIADFCRELDIDPSSVGPETNLKDIPQWDSLGMVRFLLLCDEKYGIQLPAVSAGQAGTLAELKSRVEAADGELSE